MHVARGSWFRFHGFEPLVPRPSLRSYLASMPLSALVLKHPVWSGVVTMMATCLAAALVFLVVYRCCLKPRLMKDIAVANKSKAAAVSDTGSAAASAPAGGT